MATQIEQKRIELQLRLDGGKTQAERNRMGQFATPTALARDILAYAKTLMTTISELSFLDPAIGTGSFFSALQHTFDNSTIIKAEGFDRTFRVSEENSSQLAGIT